LRPIKASEGRGAKERIGGREIFGGSSEEFGEESEIVERFCRFLLQNRKKKCF